MSHRGWGGPQRRGRGGGRGNFHGYGAAVPANHATVPPDGNANFSSNSGAFSALRNYFNSVEGRNYGELRSLQNSTFQLSESVHCTFFSIQPDPFAPGSQVRFTCPCTFSLLKILQTTDVESANPCRRVAAEDYILRAFCAGYRNNVPRIRSGAVQVLRPSQHVLERSTVSLVRAPCEGDYQFNSEGAAVEFFVRVKLPGHGRRIDGRGACDIFYGELLPLFEKCVVGLDGEALYQHVTCVHDQEDLRSQLRNAGYVAFVANGAILPRGAGNADTPLRDNAVPFKSPKSLECSFSLPHSGTTITGMGLPPGLTLIAGGGFHGKSTLLRALEVGVYNHTPDDGRVYVVVDPTAVKIRAEDRRSVHGVDISPFINNLPFQKTTNFFVTSDASGSTSQAANIMEALELGSQLLLLDEDTCATNLMYRDAQMQMLVPRNQEPITPFVERVTDLLRNHDVSSIMVVGGSGQYFPQARVVLVMNSYQTHDCTFEAKEIAKRSSAEVIKVSEELPTAFVPNVNRNFDSKGSFATVRPRHGREGTKVSGNGKDEIRFSDEVIDLSMVEQIVEEGQVNAVAQCLALLYDEEPRCVEAMTARGRTLEVIPSPSGLCSTARGKFGSNFSAMIVGCCSYQREKRLELRTPSCYLPRGFTSAVRHFEIGAALNRLRTLRTVATKL
uniref:Mitochondrial RNA binding complex 1 subunit n=1 Tax=Trypanosoma congolense (strain IL3000) TaxID=1068625 RepID=G0UJU2_TRYCI|nr:conserved hypothetical protein [Trypanosoma congolense IL3000]